MTQPAARQGFSLSHDEALVMLTKARGILEDLHILQAEAATLEVVKPAAEDPASKGYNVQLTWNGQVGAFGQGSQHVQREAEYVGALIVKLEEALGLTLSGDQQRGDAIKRGFL